MTPQSAPKVLVVQADPDAAESLLVELQGAGYRVRVASPGVDGKEVLEHFSPEVTVVDLEKSGSAGAAFLAHARETHEAGALVGLTPTGSAEDTTRAIRAGADTTVEASAAAEQLVPVVDRALEKARVAKEVTQLRGRADEILSLARFDAIIGSHPAVQELLTKVAYIARTRVTVLLAGESGTGKELVAAAIHQNSKRKSGPFIRLNCAALAESVLESELFGHERGAFTGAVARREGRFKQADGGTLFLDEISEVPLSVQVKLLRFLQERDFERVGGNETLKVDVRIVAATNRDLKALIDDGRFREDLYYRLAVAKLDVPPLRARPSDIIPLATHFLRLSAAENEIDVVGFSEDARQALLAYAWPGNVRELQNAVEQAVILAQSGLVQAGDLPIATPASPDESLKLLIPGATMAELERFAITETLAAVGGSVSKAADILGISRRTIQYRMKEWGLQHRSSPAPGGGDVE